MKWDRYMKFLDPLSRVSTRNDDERLTETGMKK